MSEPQHLPHCKPVQINFVGTPGPPHAGWQCVAECPNYQARMGRYAAEAQRIVGRGLAQAAGRGPTPST